MKKEIVVIVGQKNWFEDKIINFYTTFIYLVKLACIACIIKKKKNNNNNTKRTCSENLV